MGKYQVKSETIDAFQWTGGMDQTEYPEWIVEAVKNGTAWFVTKENHIFMVVLIQHRQVLAEPGNYIFQDKDGINVASKENFEKMFIPVVEVQLSETINKYIDEQNKKSQQEILDFIKRFYGG